MRLRGFSPRGRSRVVARAVLDRWRTIRAMSGRRVTAVGFPAHPKLPVLQFTSIAGRPHHPVAVRSRLRAQFGVAVELRPDDVSPATLGRLYELARAGVALVLTQRSSSAADPVVRCAERVADTAELERPSMRARHSIRLRRAGWADEVRGRSVSVLLPSLRPWEVASAVSRLTDQSVGDVEVLVGAHGWHAAELALGDRASVEVIEFPSSVTLGDVLNGLTAASSGELITKCDDDDWYGSGHILDLMIAHRDSGATLVGKAAEFVYLESADVTIQRSSTGAERFSSQLAGGTLAVARADLLAAGGWPRVPRHVDVQLIDRLRRLGAATYRTHGYDYVLQRRAPGRAGHTWHAPDGYFLANADRSWRGRRIDVAAVDGLGGASTVH